MSYFVVTLVLVAVRICLGGCRILCDGVTVLRDTIKGTHLYIIVPLLSFSQRHEDASLSSALHGGE